jgi:hypothetical protein
MQLTLTTQRINKNNNVRIPVFIFRTKFVNFFIVPRQPVLALGIKLFSDRYQVFILQVLFLGYEISFEINKVFNKKGK